MITTQKFVHQAMPVLLWAVTLLASLPANGETNAPPVLDRYRVIVERNSFALRPAVLDSPSLPTAVEPKEDLFLTGLMANFSSKRCALFMITAPGKPSVFFSLREGEQNEWLDLRSVSPERGTVTALLKKPVVRARVVGAEIVLSFDVHGIKPPAVAVSAATARQRPATQIAR